MKIKKWEICLGVFLLFFFVLQAVAFDAANEQKNLSSKIIRMHVIANSDSSEDQTLKLAVRDAVNDYLGYNMKLCNDKNNALKFIKNNRENILSVAENTIAERGYDYPVDVTITEEYYPTRRYDEFSLPAGEYSSLQIKIGDYKGENWWCVVFPPLCTSSVSYSELTEMDFSNDEIEFITLDDGKTIIKFKILEILNEIKLLL